MLESEPPLHRSSSNLTTCILDNVELSRAPRRASYFYGVLLALPGFLRTISRTHGISYNRGAIGHSIFLDKKWRNATASCFNHPDDRADLQRKIDSTIGLDTRGKVQSGQPVSNPYRFAVLAYERGCAGQTCRPLCVSSEIYQPSDRA